MTNRSNLENSLTEGFIYDNNDRLTNETLLSKINIFDDIGNITHKTDACFGTDDTYEYLSANGNPYAVTSITSKHQNISDIRQIITYNSFHKVAHISEGPATATYTYNSDQQRIKMVIGKNNTGKTKYYFGGCYENIENRLNGSIVSTEEYIWIGGNAYTAVAAAKKTDGGDWVVYNIFRDHLGTITELRNSEDGSVSEYSFDAWGRRRCANDWTNYDTSSEPPLFADRGFTGHEHMTEFIHINMLASRSFSEGWNGRLYDPVVGRFLNPDNFVQQPGNTQSYNRYSYCLNNPLKYTDPSGEKFDGWMMLLQNAGNYLKSVANYKSANDCTWGEAFLDAPITVGMNINTETGEVSTYGIQRHKQATSNHQVTVSTKGSARYEPYNEQDMRMPVLVASANGEDIPIINAFSFGIGGGMPYKEGAIASSFGFFKGATSQGLYFQTKRSKSPFIFGISYDFTLYESLNNNYVHLLDLNDKGTELELGAWRIGLSESSNAFLFDDGFYINPTYRAHTGGYTEGAQFGAAEWETNTRVIPTLPWIGLLLPRYY